MKKILILILVVLLLVPGAVSAQSSSSVSQRISAIKSEIRKLQKELRVLEKSQNEGSSDIKTVSPKKEVERLTTILDKKKKEVVEIDRLLGSCDKKYPTGTAAAAAYTKRCDPLLPRYNVLKSDIQSLNHQIDVIKSTPGYF